MSVTQTIKNIYNGPFTQYLKISEKIGGTVHEQSKLFDVLFLLEINFLSIIHKYKRPVHDQEKNIFMQPITIQIRRMKRLMGNSLSSPYITHMSLVNEGIDIFEWTKHSDVEQFMRQIKNKVTPYLDKLKNNLLKLDIKHVDWIYSWNEWFQGMSNLLVDHYRDGLYWSGTERLPTLLLGDISEICRKVNHLKLFQEINQGESIVQMLKHVHVENEETEEIDGNI